MTNPSKFQGGIIAGGSVDPAGALLAGGVGAITARTGLGVYTITLNEECPAGECLLFVASGLLGGADITASISHVSNTVKTVELFDAGVAADARFDFMIIRLFDGY